MNTIQITHLGQSHRLPGDLQPSPEILELVVDSQLKVANYIKEHPNALVFKEGLIENQFGINEHEVSFLAKFLFPHGLPNDSSKLSSEKKEFIYNMGAVGIMNCLGELTTIYKTRTPEENADIEFLIDKGEDHRLILAFEEKSAMNCIQKVLKKKTNVNEVILVYGDFHNFESYCGELGFKYEKICCVSSLIIGKAYLAQNNTPVEKEEEGQTPIIQKKPIVNKKNIIRV